MNNKKVQKLLEALIDKTGNSDVDGLIREMDYLVREQIAIDEFRKIAKDYFTEEETEELIDGYNNRKSSRY
jgi:hypothetical protein